MGTTRGRRGFTRFPNHLLDALMRLRVSCCAKEIILAVVRYTTGYNRDEHPLSLSYFARVTGRHKNRVSTEVRKLIECRVLIEVEVPSPDTARILKVNEQVEDWQSTRSKAADVSKRRDVHECADRPVIDPEEEGVTIDGDRGVTKDGDTPVTENSDTPVTENSDTRVTNGSDHIKKVLKKRIKTPVFIEKAEEETKTSEEKTESVTTSSNIHQSARLAAEEVYDYYAQLVRAGARADAIRSIMKLLSQYPKPTLIACIDRYRNNGMPDSREYRIQCNNFFGRAARFSEYLPATNAEELKGDPSGIQQDKARSGLTATQRFFLNGTGHVAKG